MQLELAWQDADHLRRGLEEAAGAPIHLVLTDNTSSIMSYKHKGNRIELRLHRMFLHASPEVVRATGQWIQSGRRRRAARVVDEFIAKHHHHIREARPNRIRVRTEGEFHDIKRYFDEVNAEHFDDAIDAAITWGKMPARRPRRSIRFGTYTFEDKLIRIHPLLDQAFVPQYVVRYVVFHEMLHAAMGIEETASGRRRAHTPAFNRAERAYPEFDRANAWIEAPANLRRLLGRRFV